MLRSNLKTDSTPTITYSLITNNVVNAGSPWQITTEPGAIVCIVISGIAGMKRLTMSKGTDVSHSFDASPNGSYTVLSLVALADSNGDIEFTLDQNAGAIANNMFKLT